MSQGEQGREEKVEMMFPHVSLLFPHPSSWEGGLGLPAGREAAPHSAFYKGFFMHLLWEADKIEVTGPFKQP